MREHVVAWYTDQASALPPPVNLLRLFLNRSELTSAFGGVANMADLLMA